jgi:hypothetical protein
MTYNIWTQNRIDFNQRFKIGNFGRKSPFTKSMEERVRCYSFILSRTEQEAMGLPLVTSAVFLIAKEFW